MKKFHQSQAGFTLIEMLVVLFIIGLVIAIALPNFIAAGEKAQARADQANRKLINAQIDNYFLEFGSYPKSVDELVKRGYLRAAPTCPGGKGKYVIDLSKGSSAEERIACWR